MEEYRSLLESNLEEQGRLARLIDDLLFLARTDNAQAALVHARIDVGLELDAVVAFFDAMAQEKSISVSRVGESLVCADRSLLRRAVSNLVSNALRHTERGGHVDLVVDRGTDASTHIHVTDNGVGIASDEVPRVFERFYRGSTTEQHDGGVGLGLAIVRSIMSLHGGTVEIVSKPLKGTTATLHFP
jgi:two-component system heavy metal sensor histidine kinase CusS